MVIFAFKQMLCLLSRPWSKMMTVVSVKDLGFAHYFEQPPQRNVHTQTCRAFRSTADPDNHNAFALPTFQIQQLGQWRSTCPSSGRFRYEGLWCQVSNNNDNGMQ